MATSSPPRRGDAQEEVQGNREQSEEEEGRSHCTPGALEKSRATPVKAGQLSHLSVHSVLSNNCRARVALVQWDQRCNRVNIMVQRYSISSCFSQSHMKGSLQVPHREVKPGAH